MCVDDHITRILGWFPNSLEGVSQVFDQVMKRSNWVWFTRWAVLQKSGVPILSI